MVTLNIKDVPKSAFLKSEYNAEEVIKILFQNLDYNIEYDYFSKKEIEGLEKSSNWNYDKISKLID